MAALSATERGGIRAVINMDMIRYQEHSEPERAA